MIEVSVKLFAVAKDLVGMPETKLSLHPQSTAANVLDYFIQTNPKFAEWRKHIRVAVNCEYVDLNQPLHDGDEVAIIPPVSGG